MKKNDTCDLLGRTRSGLRHTISRDRNTRGLEDLSRPPEEFFGDSVAQLGDAHDRRVTLLHKLVLAYQVISISIQPASESPNQPRSGKSTILTRQLVSSQSKSILDDLLVQIALQLENDLADRHPGGPIIKTSLSLSHSALVSGRVDTDVGADARVQHVLHSPQPLPDDILAVLELGGRDASVVVEQADAVVAPDQSRAARAAAGRHAWASFAILFVCAGAREQPVLCGARAAECAVLGEKRGDGLGGLQLR